MIARSERPPKAVLAIAILSFVLVFGLCSFPASAGVPEAIDLDSMKLASGDLTYLTHGVIRINNETDLAVMATSGTGSISNPFVIEGYNITGGDSDCIYVGNTTSYLIIRNCYLHNASHINFPYSGGAGIHLKNVQNATVTDNVCTENSWGVVLLYSSDNSVTNNSCNDNQNGMGGGHSEGNLFSNNSCDRNAFHGIYLTYSIENVLSNNSCDHNQYYGIGLEYEVKNNILSNNSCDFNGLDGILLNSNCNNNIVTNNSCDHNEYPGIALASSDNNQVSNNSCNFNKWFGIYGYNARGNIITYNNIGFNEFQGIFLGIMNFNNSIYGNALVDNNGASSTYSASHVQACDDTGANAWNSSSQGNFWSDWTSPDDNHDGLVDSPYIIGGNGSIDHYPLAPAANITSPSAPQNLSVMTGDGFCLLSWTAPSDHGLGNLTYHLFRNDQLIWSGSDASYNDTGVTNGIGYEYEVAASNSVGWGPNSTAISATPMRLPQKPDAPSGLHAIPGSNEIMLNWTAPAYSGPGVLSYHLYRDHVLVWSGTSISHIDTGLTNGQEYSYEVSASSDVGWGANTSGLLATPIGAPHVPENLEVTIGAGFVNLSWSPPSHDGGSSILVYKVFRNPAPSPAIPWIVNASTGATWYNDTSVEAGTIYDYSVIAYNLVGEGDAGNITATAEAAPTVVSNDWMLYVGIVVILGVVVGAAFLMTRKRK